MQRQIKFRAWNEKDPITALPHNYRFRVNYEASADSAPKIKMTDYSYRDSLSAWRTTYGRLKAQRQTSDPVTAAGR